MVICQLGSICRHGHPANLNLPACRPQPAILHPCTCKVGGLGEYTSVCSITQGRIGYCSHPELWEQFFSNIPSCTFQGFDEHVSQDTRLSTEDVCVSDMIDISVRGRLNLDYHYTKSDLKLISGDSSDNESDAGSRSRSTFIPGPGPSYRCREYGDWHSVWRGCTTN